MNETSVTGKAIVYSGDRRPGTSGLNYRLTCKGTRRTMPMPEIA
ncbi:MAG: hypothetical protein HLUCCX14_04225 [Marinobacter excellens HL-55]|uniref:Uncharacterized protein n=1 Tax=Marinobacter excellens HL-55 TaxID=1305731 RepID=A0A0P7ZKI9_9GAMM|nr:MAG: hypothetical protein HLUCCX14_04225 [Marinobacter excellens HL-55]